MEYQNLAEMFFRKAAERRDRTRYQVRRDGRWAGVTWGEHETTVLEIAAGLISSGVDPGHRVALLCQTRPEWMEADFGILATGGLTIPIYPSNLPHECGYILANSRSAMCIVENDEQERKVRDVMEKGFEIDGKDYKVDLRLVVTMEGKGDGDRFLSLDALRSRGREGLEKGARDEIERRIGAIGPDDLATIVYTSGTTGPPKGVPQTHANHLAVVQALEHLGAMAEGDVDFAYLPLAHSFGRANEYLSTHVGTITAFAEGIPQIADNIRDTRPHYVPSVPRIFEKIYGRIRATRDQGSALMQAIFDWAVAVGRQRSQYVQRGEWVPPWVELPFRIADLLVFQRIREQLGGRVKFMISGGAPLAREIQEFFHAAGVLILEGYGLTETCPTLTANTPDAYRFGTVGKPIQGVTLRIADDGEILAKGPNIVSGYYERPDATAESWDDEGWFRTGDIGEIDEDGFLRITDRKKDLLKTSGGKYVAPQNVENMLKTQALVSQAVVIGDNRKYCTALLTLDPDDLRQFASQNGLEGAAEGLAREPKVVEAVERGVEAVNRKLASYESIKYFRILPRDFTQETGELTPSLKVKRKVVNQKFADVIEEMYGS